MGTITVAPSLQAAYDKLASTTEGAYLIGGLQASSQNTVISTINNGNSADAGGTDPSTGAVQINLAFNGTTDRQVLTLAHELSHSLDVADGNAATYREDTFTVPEAGAQVASNVGEALAYEAQITVASEGKIDVSNGNWPDWTSTDLKDAGGFQSFYNSIAATVVSAVASAPSNTPNPVDPTGDPNGGDPAATVDPSYGGDAPDDAYLWSGDDYYVFDDGSGNDPDGYYN
jgi:hypothetical protein